MEPTSITPLARSEKSERSLRDIGILDFLEHDPRPTFVLDLAGSFGEHNELVLSIYSNPAMAAVDGGTLLKKLSSNDLANGVAERGPVLKDFKSWISTRGKTINYLGHCWTRVVLEGQWTVIFGATIESSAVPATTEPELKALTKRISRSKAPTFDWTGELPPKRITPHVAWARSIDWSKTPLGSMSAWSSQLRSIANLVMQDPRPAVVFYGPELIMIYNEAEVELLGGFHPCMGVSARIALSTVWPRYFEPIIEQNLRGETVEQTDSAIHMVRNGFMEETYFSLKFIPILNSEGATVGHYEPLTETVSIVLCLICRLECS